MNSTIQSEDMASLEVLHTENDSGSFPSGEYSLLQELSVGPVQNGDINHHINDSFNLTNMQSALTSSMQDSSGEVHLELGELIKENNRLKEKLNKNKTMIEEHMSTIKSWRDHMILSSNQQQENLEKANEEISSLKKENAELHELIKTKEEKVKDSCMQCTTLKTALDNILRIDFQESNGDVLCELSYFRKNLHQNLIAVCRHLEVVSNSNISAEEKKLVQTFSLLLKLKIASIEGDFCTTVRSDEETGYEVVHQKIHEDETQKFHKEIEELGEKVKDKDKELICLKKERQEDTEKVKSLELKIQELEMALKSQFELMSNKLQMESALSEKYRERCENMQQQIDEYQLKLEHNRAKMLDDVVVQELKEEIRNLQSILKLEQQANHNDKKKMSDVMIKCENLQVDYDRVTKLLEIQSKDEKEKSEELRLKENDAKKYMEVADHLTAQLIEVKEQLEESNSEVIKLKSQLAEIEEDAEIVPILKSQVESYKTDYYKIETAKNAASDEVEKLKNELKKYEKKQESCVCKSRSSSSRSQSRRSFSQRDQNDGAVEPINCPICQKGFSDERAAQNHINRCLEDQSSM